MSDRPQDIVDRALDRYAAAREAGRKAADEAERVKKQGDAVTPLPDVLTPFPLPERDRGG